MSKLITYSEINETDFDSWLRMGLALWDDYKEEELKKELERIYSSSNNKVLIAKDNTRAIAFINVSVRLEYVEGAATSPTGYLEGIFVEPEYRKQRIASHLLHLGEKWLKENKCHQIGSDTWLDNTASQAFHKKIGFREEEKLVHFLKDIG